MRPIVDRISWSHTRHSTLQTINIIRPMNKHVTSSVIATALLVAVGCASQPKTHLVANGDPIADAEASMKAAPTNDLVLWQYRIGTMCLRAGRADDAKSYFDQALTRINGIMGSDRTAAAARNKFKAESKKTFIGEPYERVMANFYRGLLYWKDGELDNARACFINAQFQDSDAGLAYLKASGKIDQAAKASTSKKAAAKAEEAQREKEAAETFASDYVLFDYLEGWTKAAQGSDGTDAFRRAAALAKDRVLPGYDSAAKVMVFAEYGQGPTKYATGKHNSELRFKPGITNVTSARLKIGETVHELAPYDDINFQATTRGGRVMDCILKSKAVFKSSTDTVGDVAIAAGAGTAVTAGSYGNAGGYAALGMMVFGLISKTVSAAANPAADVRCWDNLPAYLSFKAIALPPGRHEATVEFLDSTNAVVSTKTLTVDVPNQAANTVVFVSDRNY